jgi:hypothetical protein
MTWVRVRKPSPSCRRPANGLPDRLENNAFFGPGGYVVARTTYTTKGVTNTEGTSTVDPNSPANGNVIVNPQFADIGAGDMDAQPEALQSLRQHMMKVDHDSVIRWLRQQKGNATSSAREASAASRYRLDVCKRAGDGRAFLMVWCKTPPE